MSKILSNSAYKPGSFSKINPKHHNMAAGGYRDYKTHPVQVDAKKPIEVNRKPSSGSKINTPSIPTRNNTNPGLPNQVKEMEKGTTDSTRNMMIIGAIFVGAGVIYYYYR